MVLLLGAVCSMSPCSQLEILVVLQLIGQALKSLSTGAQQLFDIRDKDKHDS